MVKLIIVSIGGNFTNYLINFANFLHIPYVITSQNISCSGKDIIITDDLLITPHMLAHIYERPNIAVSTSIKIEPVMGTWSASYCAYSGFPIDLNKMDKNITCDDSIATNKFGDHAFYKMYTTDLANENERILILNTMLVYMWGEVSQITSRKLFIPLWTYYLQKKYISKNIRKMSSEDMEYVRANSLFSMDYNRIPIKNMELDDVEKLFLKLFVDFNQTMKESLNGYEIIVPCSKSLIKFHPFTVNGLIKIIPHDLYKSEIDTSITIVSFYYNISCKERSINDYKKHFSQFAAIKHPIIFYGDNETCDIILEFRRKYGLEDYTTTVKKDLYSWDLIAKNIKYFEDTMDSDIKYNPRYYILTCLKIYAVVEAISQFKITGRCCWMDPGVYKHHFMRSMSLYGEPILKNIEFDEHAITMQSFTSCPISSNEEYINGKEAVLCWLMIAMPAIWEEFFLIYKHFIEISHKQGIVKSEQMVLTRLVTLYPKYFNLLEGTLNEGPVLKMLHL